MSNAAFAAALAALFETATAQALKAVAEPLEARIVALEDALRADPYSDRIDAQLTAFNDRLAKLESAADAAADYSAMTTDLRAAIEEVAKRAAEEAIDEHTSVYDHDDYDSHLTDDDKHMDEDAVDDTVREAISEMVRQATLSVRW